MNLDELTEAFDKSQLEPISSEQWKEIRDLITKSQQLLQEERQAMQVDDETLHRKFGILNEQRIK